MFRPGLSLFTRILLWFALSVLVLVLLLVTVFNFQLRIAPLSPLRAVSADGLETVAHLLMQDIEKLPQGEWDSELARRSEAYGVTLLLFSEAGDQLAGSQEELPDEFRAEIRRWRESVGLQGVVGSASGDRRHPPQRGVPPPPGGERPTGAPTPPPGGERSGGTPTPLPADPDAHPGRFVIRAGDPPRYWGGVPVVLAPDRQRPHVPAVLVAVSDRRDGNGLFFDARPWILVGAAVLLVSVLLWIPLVRSIASPIARMTAVTERIARGDFDARVEQTRRDELGRLGTAINDMAGRLGPLVRGQKRFLADVAHELSSPIARLELGLGLLEQGGKHPSERIDDIRDDVQHMGELVQELVLYARAEDDPSRAVLGPTLLRPLVDKAVQRERGACDVVVDMKDDLAVVASPALLTRALANLIRNAVRYAGTAGPITVTGQSSSGRVTIEVRDSGPGVEEENLSRLFAPFYRPDVSRQGGAGGVGLGLAIVKTCVEACRGRVAVRNVEPHGLAVTIELERAGSGHPGEGLR